MAYCIPRKTAERIKEAASRGDFNVEELYKATHDGRVDYFKNFTNERAAKEITKKFEKAVTSGQQESLEKFVKEAVGVEIDKKGMKEAKKMIGEDVFDPSESADFLRGLVDKTIGVDVNSKDFQKIIKISNKIEESYKVIDSNGGYNKVLEKMASAVADETDGVIKKMTVGGKSVPESQYYEKQLTDLLLLNKQVDELVGNLAPSSISNVLTKSYGRAAMLASAKTVVFANAVFNVVSGVTEAVVRRGAAMSGSFDSKIASSYAKSFRRIRSKTGFDLHRVDGLDTEDLLGNLGQVVGEERVRIGNNGLFRKGAGFVSDNVFNLLGLVDSKFSTRSITDSISVNVKANQKTMGWTDKEARDVMLDALSISPQTENGLTMKLHSRNEGLIPVFQNDGVATRAVKGIRNVIDDASNGMGVDINAGTMFTPYAVAPTNAMVLSAKYAGFGSASGIFKLSKRYKEATRTLTSKTSSEKDKIDAYFHLKDAYSDVARTGLGLSAVFAMAAYFDAGDFVGAYDTKRVAVAQLAGTNYNAMNLAPKGSTPVYVNIDLFGPLGTALVGAMQAKKKVSPEDEVIDYVNNYFNDAKSALVQGASDSPLYGGFKDLIDLGKHVVDGNGKKISQTLSKMIIARTLPAQLSDIAKASDDTKRSSFPDEEGAIMFFLMSLKNETLKKIPGLRNTLPEKLDAFGDPIPEQGIIESLFFGSRITIGRETDNTVKELLRIQTDAPTDSNINITKTLKDLRYSYNNSKIILIQDKYEGKPEEFLEARKRWGEKQHKAIKKAIKTGAYKRADTDEEKMDIIKDAVFDELEVFAKREGRNPKSSKWKKRIKELKEK